MARWRVGWGGVEWSGDTKERLLSTIKIYYEEFVLKYVVAILTSY